MEQKFPKFSTLDHKKISEWKSKISEEITKINRPDLFIKYIEKKKWLKERKVKFNGFSMNIIEKIENEQQKR